MKQKYRPTIVIIIISILVFFLYCPAFGIESEKTATFSGRWPFRATKALAVDTAKNLVFMGNGDRLCILDPDLNPVSLFEVTDSGEIAGIFYSAADSLVYTACKKDGLWIIDVSDPENPYKAGAYFPENESVEVLGVYATDSHMAYLACGLDGMEIVNVSDPGNTTLMGSLRLPGAWGITYALDIYASGDYAWAADIQNGIHVIDISDPTDPEGKKLIALPGARDMDFSGNYLYAALEGNGLEIIDITEPEDPLEMVHYDTDGMERAVRVNGDTAYLAYAESGIRLIDVTDKTAPIHDPSWEYTDANANSIALFSEKNCLYMTDDQTGLQKIDVTDKTNLHQTASYDTPAGAVAIDVSGGYLYMVDDNAGDDPASEGLRVLAISNINNVIQFTLTGFCSTPGTAKDVAVAGDYAYVADGDHGLQVVSILDKTDPEITGSYDTAGSAESVFVNGSHAYVADGDAGLDIIDISDKAHPSLAGSLDTDGFAGDVTVLGNNAYVADGSEGMVIVDIAKPADPKKTAALNIEGGANGVFAFGTYAYVAAGKKGMAVVGIADPSNPKLIGSYNTPGDGTKISVAGDFAYIADGKKGVCVINISNPAKPTKEEGWSFDSTGIATDVFSGYSIEEELYAFIADGPAGVVAFNLTYKDTGIGPGQSAGGGGGGCFIQTVFR